MFEALARIFRKKQSEQEQPQADDLKTTILKAFEKMENRCVDCTTIGLTETEPKMQPGQLISLDKKYFSTENLDWDEQKLAQENTPYLKVNLVIEGNERYIVCYERETVRVLLPIKYSIWATNTVCYGKDNFDAIIDHLSGNELPSSESVNKNLERSLVHYKLITRREMERAGVYSALEKMEQRQYSPHEQIMVDMREGMAKAERK